MKIFGELPNALEQEIFEDMLKERKAVNFAYIELKKELSDSGESVSLTEISKMINKIIYDMGVTGRQKEALEGFFDFFVRASRSIGLSKADELATMIITGTIPEELLPSKEETEMNVMKHPSELKSHIHNKLGFFPELVASIIAITTTTTNDIHGLEIKTNGTSSARIDILFVDAPNIILYGLKDGNATFIIQKKKDRDIPIFEAGLLS